MALEPEALEILRRNSGIGLTADGVFTYEGRPLENPRVQALFHRGLAVREDGEVTLTVGHMWAYVAADGVASFVRTLREDGDAARAELLTGEARDAREMTLAYAASDDRFYAWFAGGPGPARLLWEAHQVLAGRVADGPSVQLGGATLPVTTLAHAPAADARPPAG